MTQYELRFYTGDVSNAGTDGAVKVNLHGANFNDQTGWRELNHSGNDFSRGAVDTYTISTSDSIKTLRSIDVKLEKYQVFGANVATDSWYLEKFYITNLDTKEEWLVLVNSWFTTEIIEGFEERNSMEQIFGGSDFKVVKRSVDAAVPWKDNDNRRFFFKDNQYIRYDFATDKAHPGYPKHIKGNWFGMEAFADGIDAAVKWDSSKIFFFKGNQCIRYDMAADKADPGYPQPLTHKWSGIEAFADGIDAAVNWGNGKIFFFKGNQYIRYDIATDKADAGYPKPIKGHWSGLEAFADGIDAVLMWSKENAMFFKGNQYIRYDIATDKAVAGYPKPINDNAWPGLAFYQE